MYFSTNFDRLSKAERTMKYFYSIRPAMNVGALFSDGTDFYRSPEEPMAGDDLRIRFRTAVDNVDHVVLIWNDQHYNMEFAFSDKQFDYYEYTIRDLPDRTCSYYFQIKSGRITCYYNKMGTVKDLNSYYNFEIVPGYTTPDWAKGAVFYQIFVDRFCNGDPSNDVLDNEYSYIGEGTIRVTDWNSRPENMDVRRFYGGDLQGVINKLDYLKDLGVDVIYLNPIFVSPSNHKYDIQDYDYVDPHFGRIIKDEGDLLGYGQAPNYEATRYIMRVTDKVNLEASNQLFIHLVEEVHKRGMKIILDGVFNHCGSFNKWMDKECIYENQEGYEKGAFVSADSPYRTYFKFHDEYHWPYNPSYDGWWGNDTLPKLNYEESPKLYEYIMKIARKWVSPPYNVDGWRLDVAADLGHSSEFNHKFWKDFRKNVKEANPNALILAEHYGDPKEWLNGGEWDTVMNYDAFMEPISWFLTGIEKHSDEFRGDLLGNPDTFIGALRHHMSRFHHQSLYISMNELSNHDHSRFLTRTNRMVGRIHTVGVDAADQNVNKGVFREAVVFQMTWPGAPTIYYGDEAGVCGWTDPDSRRTYPWGHEDQDLIDFHKEIIRIHKENPALMRGSYRFLLGEHKLVAYGRFDQNNKVVVILNNNYEDMELKFSVAEIGIPDRSVLTQLILSTEDGYLTDPMPYRVTNNRLYVRMPKISAMVLRLNI
ncbi:MAG: glycoside hydrolase family 13 protein [Lachnospiraceae bacterium]|nr:glycoside hydrolase family 13 protein [Lachnospiraceae bacterium]